MSHSEEIPTPNSVVADFLHRDLGLFIDGEFAPALDSARLDVEDPATGQLLARVASAGAGDIDCAVRAAARAIDHGSPWQRMTAATRSRLMYRLADLMEEHIEDFVQLEALDGGKVASSARGFDVDFAIRHFRYFAGWPTKIEGETIPVDFPDMMVHTRKEPVGVVAQIIPWNFPVLMAAWKLAPALAAGCTIVLKPAEQTPLSALFLAELIAEVGFPPGVVNIVPGTGPTAGDALVNHPLVNKIAFTGSTRVGTAIAAQAAKEAKRVTLELGGKSPNIIFADSPLETSIAGAFAGIFPNAGQSCSAGSRLFIEASVFDDVVAGLADRATSMRLGHGLRTDTDMGPLISRRQLETVSGYVNGALEAGARAVAGAQTHPEGTHPEGHFMAPTVLVDVTDDMKAVREEIFGPVVVATPFDTLDEVAARANDTPYGLAAGIWTRDIGRANQLANRLKAGIVYLNTYGNTDAAVPFGGYGASGYGREMGHANLDAYLEVKSVWTNLA